MHYKLTLSRHPPEPVRASRRTPPMTPLREISFLVNTCFANVPHPPLCRQMLSPFINSYRKAVNIFSKVWNFGTFFDNSFSPPGIGDDLYLVWFKT